MHPVKKETGCVNRFGGVEVALLVLRASDLVAFRNVGVDVFPVGGPVHADGDVKRYEQTKQNNTEPVNVVATNPWNNTGFIHAHPLWHNHITTPFTGLDRDPKLLLESGTQGNLIMHGVPDESCLSDAAEHCAWRLWH